MEELTFLDHGKHEDFWVFPRSPFETRAKENSSPPRAGALFRETLPTLSNKGVTELKAGKNCPL